MVEFLLLELVYLGIRDCFHTLCVLKAVRAQFFPKVQPSLPPPEAGHSQHEK